MRNRRFFYSLLTLAYFALISSVSAQELLTTEGTTKYYHIENTEEGIPEFVQTLAWFKQEDVLYYDVHIEQKTEDNSYKEILTLEKVENNSVDIKLKPGFYRYYVIAYNLLEEPEIRSEILNFEILLAIQPEVDSVSPKIIYLEEINSGFFTLTGKNFLPETFFDLRLYSDSDRTKYSSSTPFVGKPVLNSHGTKAEIKYDVNRLAPGDYQFTAQNPGGLNSSQELIIKYQKPMDLDVSIGYHPAMVIKDSTIPDYFDTNKIPLGIGAKLTWIPFKKRSGFYGIGVNPSYYMLSAQYPGYKISTNIFTAHLNLVYQYPLIRNHLTFELHAGAGILQLRDLKLEFNSGSTSPALTSTYYSADAGLAFQLYVHRHTYVELQAEYIMSKDSSSAIDLFAPSLSIGHQF